MLNADNQRVRLHDGERGDAGALATAANTAMTVLSISDEKIAELSAQSVAYKPFELLLSNSIVSQVDEMACVLIKDYSRI